MKQWSSKSTNAACTTKTLHVHKSSCRNGDMKKPGGSSLINWATRVSGRGSSNSDAMYVTLIISELDCMSPWFGFYMCPLTPMMASLLFQKSRTMAILLAAKSPVLSTGFELEQIFGNGLLKQARKMRRREGTKKYTSCTWCIKNPRTYLTG